MPGLHIEDQLETGGSRVAQHPVDDGVALAATIAAIPPWLRLADDGDEFVGRNDVLIRDGSVRRGLLLQSIRQCLVLEAPQYSHPLRPRIAIPGDENIACEKRGLIAGP